MRRESAAYPRWALAQGFPRHTRARMSGWPCLLSCKPGNTHTQAARVHMRSIHTNHAHCSPIRTQQSIIRGLRPLGVAPVVA